MRKWGTILVIEVKINITIHIEKEHITHIEMMLFLSKSTFRQYMALPRCDFDTFVTSVRVATTYHSRIHIIL